MPPLDLARDTIRAFQRNGLPDLASAMAFQAILAIVPFLLFVLALTVLFDLEEIWREDVSPDVRAAVSRSAFELIDVTVDQIIGRRQLWWLTAGLALTLWELSAATTFSRSCRARWLWEPRSGSASWPRSRSSASGRSSRASSTASLPLCRSSCAGCWPRPCWG